VCFDVLRSVSKNWNDIRSEPQKMALRIVGGLSSSKSSNAQFFTDDISTA
jgi:hypothetical protein